MSSPILFLKKGKEEAIARKHPWVFSGALMPFNFALQDGDIVKLANAKKEIIATGYYSTGSIAIRILSFEETEIDAKFWFNAIQNAFNARLALGFIDNPETNCFRLVHGEGDQVSGLIIDIYGKVAIIQCHTIGIYNFQKEIADAIMNVETLKATSHFKIEAVYSKSAETLPPEFVREKNIKNDYVGENKMSTPYNCIENGIHFYIDWVTGQKTGFFLDQRDNRAALSKYVSGKKVLNAFCYSGGFSMYALKSGADFVTSVDISGKAMQLVEENLKLNHFDTTKHESITADVLQFLKEQTAIYDVIVIDPPAFAKSLSKRHNAVQAYTRLNAMAIQAVKNNGFIFTFSCSQVVSTQLFTDAVMAAAIQQKRNVRIVARLTQGADHPVNIFHPEGHYLKGLILFVSDPD